MSSWSIPFSEVGHRMRLRVDEAVRTATAQLFLLVVDRSPVDTGRFRANWNVSLGQPDSSTTPSTDVARAMLEVEKVLTFPTGQRIYLTNGLPYALPLEYGHSKQAPHGMVRTSAAEFGVILRQEARP